MAVINAKMQQRRDTAANWSSNNPTLAAGEIGVETDTNKFKFGDGATAWNSLLYATTGIGDASINALADVDTSTATPAPGQTLAWDGSQWVPGPVVSEVTYTSDPEFENVALLLHMDGSNNSATFIDSSLNAHTITPSGNVKISTAQSKFGGSSALFDGSGDFLTVPSGAQLSGSGDFTIEAWVYVSAYPATANYQLYSQHAGSTAHINFELRSDGYFACFFGATSAYLVSSTQLPLNTWTHIAVVRRVASLSIYQAGSQVASATSTPNISTGTARIGREGGSATTWDWNGYIDEFRISRLARYTSNFTPPAAPFPGVTTAIFDNNISTLSDVDTKSTPPISGQALIWSGSQWIPGSVAVESGATTIDELNDVDTTTTSPTNGQALIWDALTSSWKPGDIAGGDGGSSAIESLTYTTGSLAAGTSADFTLNLGTVYTLLSVTSDFPAWIRIYGTDTARTSDTRTTPGYPYPASGTGFYAELVTTATPQTITLAPTPICQGASSIGYVRVVNRDAATRTLQLTFTYITTIS